MAKSEPAEQPRQPPVEREPYIPRPPSRAAIEEISREQALITDEWTGEEKPEGSRQPPAGG